MSLMLRRGEKVEMKGRRITVTPKAYECLPRLRDYLIDVARADARVTYGQVVRDLGLPYLPRGLGRILDLLSEAATVATGPRWLPSLSATPPARSAPTSLAMRSPSDGTSFFTGEVGATSVRAMSEGITPNHLANELGVSAPTVRQWLRDQGWQSVPHARWHLSEDQAAQVREHFLR